MTMEETNLESFLSKGNRTNMGPDVAMTRSIGAGKGKGFLFDRGL